MSENILSDMKKPLKLRPSRALFLSGMKKAPGETEGFNAKKNETSLFSGCNKGANFRTYT